MAGCVPCFIIPLLLFIFHRFIQPIILRYWNPWEGKKVTQGVIEKPVCDSNGTENCKEMKSGAGAITDSATDKLKTS